LFVAAAPSIFQAKRACGKHFTIRCVGSSCKGHKSIRVVVVDLCPGCPGAFDLSKEAFEKLANPDAGVIDIDFH
ncbi:hypothetical protein SELMODRAFT_18782, partial [Selaginella moellendorffii]